MPRSRRRKTSAAVLERAWPKAAAGGIRRRHRSRAFRPGSLNQGFDLLEPRQLLSGTDLTQDIKNLLQSGTIVRLGDDQRRGAGELPDRRLRNHHLPKHQPAGPDWSGYGLGFRADGIGRDRAGAHRTDPGRRDGGQRRAEWNVHAERPARGPGSLPAQRNPAHGLGAQRALRVPHRTCSSSTIPRDPAPRSSPRSARSRPQIIPFGNATATLSNLNVYQDGFSLQDGTVTTGNVHPG